MKNHEFLKLLIEHTATMDDAYFECAHLAACLLEKRLHEQLTQLINGPVWDGDICSKANRSELFSLGLAVRVCHKGEQGYTGATYFAHSIIKAANAIKNGKVGA